VTWKHAKAPHFFATGWGKQLAEAHEQPGVAVPGRGGMFSLIGAGIGDLRNLIVALHSTRQKPHCERAEMLQRRFSSAPAVLSSATMENLAFGISSAENRALHRLVAVTITLGVIFLIGTGARVAPSRVTKGSAFPPICSGDLLLTGGLHGFHVTSDDLMLTVAALRA